MDHQDAPASSMLPPPKRVETVRYKKEEWDQNRPIIEGMYTLKGMNLKAIAAVLKEERDFVVNGRQLKRKIKD
ncbi:uncharacterized protein K444DRAFT_606790 [Hyaloscypha bicolor E]|uniref:Clr5 domain-containing protein n=1 Tax=Hyaloscypha bicolor E TaxID=1095630 RepID=A0A2J6TTX9_9HELO|nr:uncharacterized protein K444DRAFT_606790 [Hyaloscypha bicolor E]PMD66482.1 hypothetical protein K444DRAFT_606790 [Hyaloscypha bicolor E]